MTHDEFAQLISDLDRAVTEGRAPSSTIRLLREERSSRYYRHFEGSRRHAPLAELRAELARCAPADDAIAPLLADSLELAKTASERSLLTQAWAARRRAS